MPLRLREMRSTSLGGNTRNAIAWAPLSDPTDITVEGSVPRSRAWSTSKVLVIAAYLDTVVAGDPDAIPVEVRGWIQKALAESDNDAIDAIRREIPGSQGQAMTRILRAVGDTTTNAPDSYIGTMQWRVAEQVRFMAALGNGQVVSPEASAYLLREMQPDPLAAMGTGRHRCPRVQARLGERADRDPTDGHRRQLRGRDHHRRRRPCHPPRRRRLRTRVATEPPRPATGDGLRA